MLDDAASNITRPYRGHHERERRIPVRRVPPPRSIHQLIAHLRAGGRAHYRRAVNVTDVAITRGSGRRPAQLSFAVRLRRGSNPRDVFRGSVRLQPSARAWQMLLAS
jgi:hypothetical protein